MDDTAPPSRHDRLYLRALEIREKRAGGLWVPIMRHLALRRHTGAMIDLASWLSDDNTAESFGKPADAHSPAGLYRRAYRMGDLRAAQHVAMSHFNRDRMAGYRHWLGLGAKAGNAEAAHDLPLLRDAPVALLCPEDRPAAAEAEAGRVLVKPLSGSCGGNRLTWQFTTTCGHPFCE